MKHRVVWKFEDANTQTFEMYGTHGHGKEMKWSGSSMWATYDILEIWKWRAADVQGVALECGHFLPEEDPERTAAELIRFLS